MSVSFTAVLWEAYDGKRYVGYGDRVYSGKRGRVATHADENDDVGWYATRGEAMRALRKRDRELRS
jgi:hypothetical protein